MIIYFLLQLEPSRIDGFVTYFMIISKKEFIDENIILLPLCSPVFIRYADDLRSNYKFMDAFKLLFSSFNHYTLNVAQYVIKSFRIAIMNCHGIDYIKQMLHVVFQSPPVKPGKISPFDVFFSTFTDCSSQLTKYFSGFDYDDFFADLKQRNDLPPSFLRFLIDLSEYFPFSTDMLWSYSIKHPSLLFTYISHLDFDHITKTWIAIFERMTSLPRTDESLDWHITILLFFLSHVRSHPDLMKTFLAKNVHQWMISVLWSIRLESMSDRKNAFLAITLIFTRIDEIIARTLSANVVFKDLFDNYTDNKSNIDVIGKIILWILIPNQAFPFHNQLRNEVLVSNNVGISMTFTKEIIPNLLSLYLKLGIQNTPFTESFLEFLETLVKIATEDNYRQFLLGKTLTEDLLMIFVQHWDEHPIIFKFIAVSLSLNCNFYVFSKIFNNISSDLSKTIEFLNILSENTPIVNDFLHIDSPFPLNSNMMNGSIVMWVRLHSSLSQIIQIVSGKHKIVFANNSNNVYVQDNEKFICKFPLGQGIEGWHLCHIRLETKRSSFSFDLNEKHVDIPLDSTTSLTLGGIDVSFDIQSLRLFRPTLHKSELLYLFSLGPNMKEFLYRDFVSIAYQTPSFVIGNSFISSLYTEWVNLLYSNVEEKEIFGKKFELSISPPFQEIISMRRSANTSDNNKKETILTSLTDNTPLFSNRLQFKDFINSLEAFGGSSIITHIIAEAILKHPDQQRGAIKLLHNLVNRFPFFHVSFVKKKLYQALGQLLWTPNLDFHVIEDYAATFYQENIILCNVHLLKNFLFGPTLYHCNLSNLITMINRSIASGPYSNHNRNVLIKMDAFTLIIQSISNSTQHTRGFLDVLANLASSITDQLSAQTYISKLFSFIMINHLSFSLSDSNTDEAFDASTPLSEFRSRVACPASLRSTKSTVTMISLLTSLLSKYRANIDIKLMLGAFITSSVKVQISLIDLLLKNVESQNLLYIFGFVIIHLGNSSKIAQYLYAFGQAMMSPNIFRIHYVTIPILYMISHEGYNEYISALASASILTLKQIKKIETICYEHLLMIIKLVEDRFLVPQIITIDSNSFSSTVSPLSNFFTVILQKCLENEDYYMLEKFFISIFAFKTIPDYRLSCVSLFLLARIIENTQNKIKFSFLNFVVTFASFVFNRIHLIPGEKSELLSNILVYFIRQVLENVEDINNNETINKVFDMLDDFASLNTSNTNLILEDVKRHKKLNKHKRAFETIDRLENPTSFAPNKAKKPSFDQDLKKFEEIVLERDKKDVTALLTIVCNAISYQALHASDVTTVGVKIDTMIDTWHEVFQSLMGESSIFGDCPPKYCLNETTTDPSVRRILFPLNPAIDRVYLSYWKEKYQKPPPKVRLTLADVMQFAPSLYMEDDILFNGDAVRLAGISMLKGVIVVTKDSIKFYQKPKSDSFFEELMRIKISDLRSVRLTMFQHLPKGIIIEDNMECLFIFALETPSLRDRFVDILQGIGVKVMSGINKEELSKATQMWCEGKLSTFNYILKLNFISGRSWSDFTQFPIFPWTITDFTSETPRGFRDFRYPIFAQTPQQQKSLTDYYNATLQMNIEPYHFSNYVSNVGSSLYFLIRLEPFTDELITFQSGSFDAADRTFQSMQITKELMTSSSAKSALEMVAEIYLIPELYVNTNNLVFPESPITHRDINNVVLPPWADNSPEKLVREMRKALESDQTSENLNEWIDLIWGVRRQGNLAFQRFNVLQPIIFQFDPEKYVNDRILMKAVIEQIHNCGQAPVQLFYDFHPKRFYSLQRKVTLVNVQNNLPYNDSMKMYKIKRDDDWFRLPNSYKVRICCGKIEYMHTKMSISQTGSAFAFADEIRPICIHTDNCEIVTAHKIPIINHWQATSIGLKHKATLRGHLEKISTVFISSQAKMIIAGHVDGKISTFTSDSHRFLRILEGHLASPIIKIVMCVATGNFVVVQKVNDKTVLTLFSVNGKMQTIREFEEQIKDVSVTNFPDGVHDNYFLVLTEKSLVLVKEGTLKTKETFMLEEKPRSVSINIWNGTNILISREDRSLSLWTFVAQK